MTTWESLSSDERKRLWDQFKPKVKDLYLVSWLDPEKERHNEDQYALALSRLRRHLKMEVGCENAAY